MVTIDVLVSREEAKQKLDHYREQNRAVSRQISVKADQRWSEYCAASGRTPEFGAPSTNGLPKKLYKKIWAGNGEGLEVYPLFRLFANERGFGYEVGAIYDPKGGTLDELPDLSILVQKVEQMVSNCRTWFLGATITPVFYTCSGKYFSEVIKGSPNPFEGMTPEEIKKEVRELKKAGNILVGIFGSCLFSPKELRELKAEMKNADYLKEAEEGVKDKEIYARGLTEEEIKEFERLFNKQ